MKHKWEYKKMGDVCFPKKQIKRAAKYFNDNDLIEYIDISSIDRDNHCISTANPYIFAEAPSRAQQCVEDKDVLVSLVRPNLKNVAIVNDTRDNLIASSGFCVLRGNMLLPKYVYYLVTSASFTDKLVSKCAGAAYPAVNEDDVKSILIPVPPMEVQKHIVAELDKINEIISDCKEAIRNLDSLAQSLFYDYFGDPITNPKGWEVKKIEDVCILKSGDSSSNNLPYGLVPYVKVADMNLKENKYGIITSSKFVDMDYLSKKIFPVGATIFPKRGGAILTNKKKLVKSEICCDLNIMGAIPINVHPLYLYFFFLEKDFAELVDGAVVPQINNGDIYPLPILVPPLPLQQKFAARIEQIEQQKKLLEQTIANMQTLLDSRMDFWFN